MTRTRSPKGSASCHLTSYVPSWRPAACGPWYSGGAVNGHPADWLAVVSGRLVMFDRHAGADAFPEDVDNCVRDPGEKAGDDLVGVRLHRVRTRKAEPVVGWRSSHRAASANEAQGRE